MARVKCVVWDLDDTVWPGVAIESSDDTLPTPYPAALAAMSLLAERGIASSVASRTDPSLAEAVRQHPDLADRVIAPQLGWGDKSEAVARIADELGIATSALAFVDDNPYERAEVGAVLPDVLVLAPDELYARLETPEFRPAVITEEARRRVAGYRQESVRRAAERDFAGPREAFLRSTGLTLTIRRAGPTDVDRVAELAERTHRFNTTGERWPADRIREVLADDRWLVPVARLADRFGDYGVISTALIERHPDGLPAWQPRLLMVSCRAAGREVPIALLRWILRGARADGAQRLLVDVRPVAANLELRMLLRRAGFTAAEPGSGVPAEGTVLLARSVDDDLPEVPWLRVVEEGTGR
ncbi:MAG: hypothetical protein WCA46_29720 [Actinocatenispora sp.]